MDLEEYTTTKTSRAKIGLSLIKDPAEVKCIEKLLSKGYQMKTSHLHREAFKKRN